jgi:thioredoxin reductase (NADPH)
MQNPVHNIIIIGSGPAGLTAALYTARANLSPLVIEGSQPGGQLIGTTAVENWPGTPSIMGPQLVIDMKKHAQQWGAQFLTESATAIRGAQPPFTVATDTQKTFLAKALIIATGTSPNLLKCPGEQEYWGKGVTTCAICDGVFYKDKKVIIAGGGDSAMENASFLRKFTNDITIIQIHEKLTASYVMQQRVIGDPAIKIIYSSSITEIKGDGNHVTQVTVTNKETNESSTLDADGVFISIGAKPNTGIVENLLDLDSHGYIKVHGDTSLTSIPGIFVAGDVHDYKYKQAITAAGAGCKAALDAERYLHGQK